MTSVIVNCIITSSACDTSTVGIGAFVVGDIDGVIVTGLGVGKSDGDVDGSEIVGVAVVGLIKGVEADGEKDGFVGDCDGRGRF